MSLAIWMIAAACTVEEDIPLLERRAQQLNKVIMCPVCPGESIDQSQNPLAQQMRAIVAEQLEQGWGEGQIKQFFVERYGSSVLLDPPQRGFSLVVWLIPPLVVLGAALTLYTVLRAMRRSPPPEVPMVQALAHLTDEERDEYFHRIEKALEHELGGSSPRGDDEGAGVG